MNILKESNSHSNGFVTYVLDWINSNPGKAAGAFLGFFLGLLIITFGTIKTIFVAILILIGVIVGKLKDDKVPVLDQIKSIFKRNK